MPRGERREQLRRVASLHSRAGQLYLALNCLGGHKVVQRGDINLRALSGSDAGESQQNLPFIESPWLAVKDRRRVVRNVTDGKLRERQIVVRALQRRRR